MSLSLFSPEQIAAMSPEQLAAIVAAQPATEPTPAPQNAAERTAAAMSTVHLHGYRTDNGADAEGAEFTQAIATRGSVKNNNPAMRYKSMGGFRIRVTPWDATGKRQRELNLPASTMEAIRFMPEDEFLALLTPPEPAKVSA